jgi:hypothetical protein
MQNDHLLAVVHKRSEDRFFSGVGRKAEGRRLAAATVRLRAAGNMDPTAAEIAREDRNGDDPSKYDIDRVEELLTDIQWVLDNDYDDLWPSPVGKGHWTSRNHTVPPLTKEKAMRSIPLCTQESSCGIHFGSSADDLIYRYSKLTSDQKAIAKLQKTMTRRMKWHREGKMSAEQLMEFGDAVTSVRQDIEELKQLQVEASKQGNL